MSIREDKAQRVGQIITSNGLSGSQMISPAYASFHSSFIMGVFSFITVKLQHRKAFTLTCFCRVAAPFSVSAGDGLSPAALGGVKVADPVAVAFRVDLVLEEPVAVLAAVLAIVDGKRVGGGTLNKSWK